MVSLRIFKVIRSNNQIKLQLLIDQSQINEDNLKSASREVRQTFQGKREGISKRQYEKA
jgi:hypothetical protein